MNGGPAKASPRRDDVGAAGRSFIFRLIVGSKPMVGAKQLLVAIATIDFAFLKQNQCCFELQV